PDFMAGPGPEVQPEVVYPALKEIASARLCENQLRALDAAIRCAGSLACLLQHLDLWLVYFLLHRGFWLLLDFERFWHVQVWKCAARRTDSTRALPWRRSCWGRPEGEIDRPASHLNRLARHGTPVVAMGPPREHSENRRRDPVDVCRTQFLVDRQLQTVVAPG